MSDDKKKIHPLQRAWASGVFEAKATINKNGAVIRMDSVDESLMKRFHETLGLGQLFPIDRKECSRPIWRWQSNTLGTSHDVLKIVSPFLSASKLRGASDMLARIERNPYWIKKNKEKVISSDTDHAD